MVDASTMLGTLMQSFPGLLELFNVTLSLVGLVLTGMAVLKFIEVGRHGDHPGGVRWITPVMFLLSGAALWNFSSSVDTMLETVYGPSTSVHNLLAYSASGSKMPQQTQMMMMVLIYCLRFYGYITYARGWLSMRRIGSGQSGSDEVFKTAMVRLFAGVGLINIVETTNVFSSSLGFGDVL